MNNNNHGLHLLITFTVLALGIILLSSVAFANIVKVSSNANASGLGMSPGDTVIVGNGATLTIDISAECDRLQLGDNSAGANHGNGTVNIPAGTSLDIVYELVIGDAATKSGSVIMGAGSNLNLYKGIICSLLGTWTPGTGEVWFRGSANIPAALNTFYDVDVRTDTVTLNAATTINGSLTNEATINYGSYDIHLKGNYIAYSRFLIGTGNIIFDGTSLQTITNTDPRFGNMTVNNPAGILLTTAVSVTRTLTLTNGIISTNGSWVSIDDTGSVSGGNSGSYINGKLKRYFDAPGGERFDVGSGGYSPVTVYAGTGTFPALDPVTVEAVQGFAGGIVDTSKCLKRNWLINGAGYVATADSLIFGYPAADVRGAEASYTGLRTDGNPWGTVGGTVNTTLHTFTTGSTPLSYNDDWTVGQAGALPIILSQLSAAAIAPHSATIEWSTATETNTLGFYIQRKSDVDKDYTTVSQMIAGAGSSLDSHDYTYTDNTVNNGTYYYRLKEVDLDGNFTYSAPIKLVVTGVLGVNDKNVIPHYYALNQNYPNPFNPSTVIQYALPSSGYVTLKVYDMLGRVVSTLIDGRQDAGYQSVKWDASQNASGVYFYRISAGAFSEVKRMMLVK